MSVSAAVGEVAGGGDGGWARAVNASTDAIADNQRIVRQSTDAILQNQNALAGVTATIEKLSPANPRFKLAAGLVIAAAVALYGGLLALLIAGLRACRSLRTIETKLTAPQRRDSRISQIDHV